MNPLAKSAAVQTAFAIFLVFTLPACNGKAASLQSAWNATAAKPNASALASTSASATPAEQSDRNDDSRKPLALIYKGYGSCSADEGDAGESGYGCSEAAADVAKAAGFRYQFVGPTDLAEDATPAQVKALFGNAKVWMQPGGIAVNGFFAMNLKLRTEIVNFVSNGGGYVGFCAGAFMATAGIGATRYAGFGIISGYTTPYWYDSAGDDTEYGLIPVTWNGVVHTLYIEGGPYLSGQDQTTEIIATYADGRAAAERAPYGKGRVFISGPHPEAPAVWTEEDGIKDPDGSDLPLAVEMVKWAASQE